MSIHAYVFVQKSECGALLINTHNILFCTENRMRGGLSEHLQYMFCAEIRMRRNYSTCTYKRTVNRFRSLQITVSVLISTSL